MLNDAPLTLTNPILPGCYPDPSACRVGDDFYLVCSTFEYFPALPVFHSRDLVHWHQIGHAIDRPGQVDLGGVRSSGGLYAPTIRHHDGVFYLVNTLVDPAGGARGGNFLLTATDPAGPWSDAVWIDDAEGFDPSLFFDDDGRSWYIGTRPSAEPRWQGHTDVWLREIDVTTGRLHGDEHVLWSGAMVAAAWAEGPHLYKVDGRYVLLAAEGGTDLHHAVSVARSDRITGPYEGDPANPVLTHRHLGAAFPIVGAGHADLLEAPDGSWWAVLLAMRPYGGHHYNLGRETFLVPVAWEDGWPVFAPGVGQVRLEGEGPRLPAQPWADAVAGEHVDRFDGPSLDPRWTSLRGPASFAHLRSDSGGLELELRPETLAECATPAFLGRRQQDRDVDVSLVVRAEPAGPREWVGLAARQSEDHHLVVVLAGPEPGSGSTERRVLVVRRRSTRPPGIVSAEGVSGTGAADVVEDVVARGVVGPGDVSIELRVRGQELVVRAGVVGGPAEQLAVLDGRFLDSVSAGGFLGVWMGPYATSNGAPTSTRARVLEWRYAPV